MKLAPSVGRTSKSGLAGEGTPAYSKFQESGHPGECVPCPNRVKLTVIAIGIGIEIDRNLVLDTAEGRGLSLSKAVTNGNGNVLDKV